MVMGAWPETRQAGKEVREGTQGEIQGAFFYERLPDRWTGQKHSRSPTKQSKKLTSDVNGTMHMQVGAMSFTSLCSRAETRRRR